MNNKSAVIFAVFFAIIGLSLISVGYSFLDSSTPADDLMTWPTVFVGLLFLALCPICLIVRWFFNAFHLPDPEK